MARTAAAGALVLLAALLLWFLGTRGLFGFGSTEAEHNLAPQGAPPPPGKPLLILIAGTSATRLGTWPDELQEKLSQCRTAGVRVERLAKVGASSAWGEPQLATRLARGERPDIVIIEYAGNDARLYRGMSRSESEGRHRRMIAGVREQGATPWLATMGSVIGRERLERPFLPAWHNWYRRLAEETGAGLIDTAPGFWAMDRDTARAALPDGSHFTQEAARRLILPVFQAALAPALCDQRFTESQLAKQKNNG